jgi:hypothetical protein
LAILPANKEAVSSDFSAFLNFHLTKHGSFKQSAILLLLRGKLLSSVTNSCIIIFFFGQGFFCFVEKKKACVFFGSFLAQARNEQNRNEYRKTNINLSAQ